MGRLNKVMLIGNVGNTPEMRYTPSGQQLTSISLAVGRKYTNNEGTEVDGTQWFNVTVWAQRADFVVNYVKKGMQLYVEGRISGRAYQTESGENRASLDVNAFEVQIFNDPQSNQSAPTDFSQPTGISEQPATQPQAPSQPETPPQPETEKTDDGGPLPW